MNPDTHSLAGAYAVNAVTAEERRSFELHLDQCADCRAEVAELRAAAATMAADVELPPPPALRAAILAAVSQTRQLSPLVEGPDQPATGTPAADTTRADTTSAGSTDTGTTRDVDAPLPLPEPSGAVTVPDELASRRSRRLRPWLAAAVAAAVVTIGGLVWQPWDDAPPQQLTATEQVLRADDAQRVKQPMGDSEITIVRSPSHHRAVFVADAMPEPPSGKAYQLWFDIPGRGMVSAGLIRGGGAVTVPMDGDASVATGAGITVEPASGSEHPTSDPVALFSFT